MKLLDLCDQRLNRENKDLFSCETHSIAGQTAMCSPVRHSIAGQTAMCSPARHTLLLDRPRCKTHSIGGQTSMCSSATCSIKSCKRKYQNVWKQNNSA